MIQVSNKRALVIGVEPRAVAACELLRRLGAEVTAVELSPGTGEQRAIEELRRNGVEVMEGCLAPPGRFDLAVISPETPPTAELVKAVQLDQIPLISELELGYHNLRCLAIGVAGTNGKSTTAELIGDILVANGRTTKVAGDREHPLCSIADQTKALDYVVLNVNAFQLEHTEAFRPAIAVLLGVEPDHLDRFSSPEDFARANARLFRKQQIFDWVIAQKEALAKIRSLDLPVPGKVITFSATDQSADLFLDRGLIIGQLAGWSGPLLDYSQCRLGGPYNAENVMASLAVGRVLRVPLRTMQTRVRDYSAGPHRLQVVAEVNGVTYINDAKSRNVSALTNALLATRPAAGGAANICLIAGGRDNGSDFHSAGPLLSMRVKHAFLFGEAGEKIRAAWSLFTPCTVMKSLLEAVYEAAKLAVSGDVVLLSPSCSCFDMFRDYRERGERFCDAVKSISSVPVQTAHNK